MVLIDTEEEFDWSRPVARENTGVRSIKAQVRAHRIFEKYGITPVYVADYPVVSQKEGIEPLRDLLTDGKCVIGAHLHPWVNPPFDEEVCNLNSYPGNLPMTQEREKLKYLTETIADNFGERPTVYKAGRYGVGFNTAAILDELGYEIDTSVLSATNLSSEEGPDFSHCGTAPYWFGKNRRMLEIPMSVGYLGLFRSGGAALREALTSRMGQTLHLPGIFSRARLFDRFVLKPEGFNADHCRRLTQRLLADGHRIFSFTYHSPSLDPGNTPYVQSEQDLRNFLDVFEHYFDFFFGELGGRAATPMEIKALVANDRRGAARSATPKPGTTQASLGKATA
jgi:hypothetical protein